MQLPTRASRGLALLLLMARTVRFFVFVCLPRGFVLWTIFDHRNKQPNIPCPSGTKEIDSRAVFLLI
jgi:hypothetical protein